MPAVPGTGWRSPDRSTGTLRDIGHHPRGMHDADGATAVAEKILRACAKHSALRAETTTPTVSGVIPSNAPIHAA